MIVFSLFLLVLSIIEIYFMIKSNNKTAIWAYLILAAMAWGLGTLYISYPYGVSFSSYIIKFLGITKY